MGKTNRAQLLAIVLLASCGMPQPVNPSQPSWKIAFDATNVGWLLNAWGPSRDHLYAAGGTPDRGVIIAFDGKGWSPVDLGQDVPLLDWSWGFGASDVTTVGAKGTILHFDGSSWTSQDSGTSTEPLWGVWGAAPDDLWSVGGEHEALVLRFDGHAWSSVALPALSKTGVNAFYKVWGTSAHDVWIVGQRGTVLHWDGQALSEVDVGATQDIISIWGASGRLLAVGGRSSGQLSRFDGGSWKTVVLDGLPGLNGVWTRDGKTFHVAGTEGTLAKVTLDDLERPQVTTIERTRDFHSMFGVDGWLFSVGGTLASASGPYKGIAYERELGSGE